MSNAKTIDREFDELYAALGGNHFNSMSMGNDRLVIYAYEKNCTLTAEQLTLLTEFCKQHELALVVTH